MKMPLTLKVVFALQLIFLAMSLKGVATYSQWSLWTALTSCLTLVANVILLVGFLKHFRWTWKLGIGVHVYQIATLTYILLFQFNEISQRALVETIAKHPMEGENLENFERGVKVIFAFSMSAPILVSLFLIFIFYKYRAYFENTPKASLQ